LIFVTLSMGFFLFIFLMFRTIKLIKHLEPLFLFRFQLTFGHTPFELLFYDKFLFVTKDLVQFMEKFLYLQTKNIQPNK
jgi:hypothetical protein